MIFMNVVELKKLGVRFWFERIRSPTTATIGTDCRSVAAPSSGGGCQGQTPLSRVFE